MDPISLAIICAFALVGAIFVALVISFWIDQLMDSSYMARAIKVFRYGGIKRGKDFRTGNTFNLSDRRYLQHGYIEPYYRQHNVYLRNDKIVKL